MFAAVVFSRRTKDRSEDWPKSIPVPVSVTTFSVSYATPVPWCASGGTVGVTTTVRTHRAITLLLIAIASPLCEYRSRELQERPHYRPSIKNAKRALPVHGLIVTYCVRSRRVGFRIPRRVVRGQRAASASSGGPHRLIGARMCACCGMPHFEGTQFLPAADPSSEAVQIKIDDGGRIKCQHLAE